VSEAGARAADDDWASNGICCLLDGVTSRALLLAVTSAGWQAVVQDALHVDFDLQPIESNALMMFGVFAARNEQGGWQTSCSCTAHCVVCREAFVLPSRGPELDVLLAWGLVCL
jgi:hypothetical protein